MPGSNVMESTSRFLQDGCKRASNIARIERWKTCYDCPLKQGVMCGECGCFLPAKRSMRLEECPLQLWYPDMPRKPLTNPIKNLSYHLFPVDNPVWKWNLEQLKKRWYLFNGYRYLSISLNTQARPRCKHVTVKLDTVLDELRNQGLEFDRLSVMDNNHKLWEVPGFMDYLDRSVNVEGTDSVTFRAHAKGVTHPQSDHVHRWTEMMYSTCLDHWPTVQDALELFDIAGSFKRYGSFDTLPNTPWHYSGTFFWFRHDHQFGDWQDIDLRSHGVEAWPARHFEAAEAGCLFYDNTPSMYRPVSVEKAYEEWTRWKQVREL